MDVRGTCCSVFYDFVLVVFASGLTRLSSTSFLAVTVPLERFKRFHFSSVRAGVRSTKDDDFFYKISLK